MKKKDRRQNPNFLATHLNRGIEVVSPYFPHIGITLAVIVVGFVGFRWLSSSSTARSGDAWQEYFRVTSALSGIEFDQEIGEVAENHPGTAAGMWAKLEQADRKFAIGIQTTFGEGDDAASPNPRKGRRTINTAAALYTEVRDEARGALSGERAAILIQRATLGLARCFESANKLEEAEKEYETLVNDYPEGLYTKFATRRRVAVRRGSVADFYDQLAEYRPARPATGPGVPGEKPSTNLNDLFKDPLNSSPKSGDFDLGIEPKTPATEKTKSEAKEPGDSTPESESAKPAKKESPPDSSAKGKSKE